MIFGDFSIAVYMVNFSLVHLKQSKLIRIFILKVVKNCVCSLDFAVIYFDKNRLCFRKILGLSCHHQADQYVSMSPNRQIQ